MDEIEIDQPLFSSLIKINYDKCFIKFAQNFIESLSALAGANKNESFQISLLLEECLTFIIDKYIDSRTSAHIEIFFKLMEDQGVYIEITDIGPPIRESMIPSFDISEENSEAGLWYKLASGLSDEFEFVNRYQNGWLIKIGKKIENIKYMATESGNKIAEHNSAAEKHTRPATPDDAQSLIDLAYATYRYSYNYNNDFYNEERLKELIAEKLYEITLVEQGGKVIGASYMKYPDADRIYGESGGLMIPPEYRNGSAMVLLFKELMQYHKTNPSNCEFFYSSAVTSHIQTQKMGSKLHKGYKPLMLFLNMVPRPEFIGIKHANGGRESGLYIYHLNGELRPAKLYATAERHVEIINELVTNTGNTIQVINELAEPEPIESEISFDQHNDLQLATMHLEVIGNDWFTVLNKKIFAAIVSGIESILVTIPTSAPLPGDMEKMLGDLNFVFCGLSLRSLDKIDLAYCLTTKPIDFSQIKLFDPLAKKLLVHVEKNYKEISLAVVES